jgi:hydroxyacylglutathione hydrolase
MATVEELGTADVGITRIESAPFAQNSYVLRRPGVDDCAIVDPGFEPEAIIAVVEDRGLVPRAILLTHGHSDHIAGNAALRRRWPGVPILVGRGDAHKLVDPVANLSAPFGLPLVSPPADRLVSAGETVEVAGFALEVREIPGHSAGHVVFLVVGTAPRLVFGGDVLFRESVGRTDFPDGDAPALASGIREALYTLPDDTVVFPGHGEPTTVGHERRHNPFVPDLSAGR